MKCSIATLVIALIAVSSANAQNLLQDPSFDLSTGNTQDNPHWTLDVTFPDGTGASAQYQDAPWASNPTGTPGVGVWLRAFEGNSTDGLANATLYQDVAASAGDYELSFFFRKEANYMAENTFVEVLEDGARIDLIDLTNADTGGAFEQFSLSGTTNGGTLRVQARMVNGFDAMANPQSAMFDDFSLVVVPEPTAPLLMLMGLVGLAVGRRR